MERGEKLSETLYRIGYVLGNFAGFTDEARKYYTQAFALDGDSANYLNNMGFLELNLGNYARSHEFFAKSYALDSSSGESTGSLAANYVFQRDYRKAQYYYEKFIKILSSSGKFQTGSMVQIGFVFLQNGNNERAEYWLYEQKKLSDVSIRYGRWYSAWGYADLDLAIMHSILEEKAFAYKHLKKLNDIKACPVFFLRYLKDSPVFDNLRSEPEFELFVKNMDSKYKAEHERVSQWLKLNGKL